MKEKIRAAVMTGRRRIEIEDFDSVGCLMSAHGYEGAVKIIESNRFPIQDVVTTEFPLDKIQEAFEYIETRRDSSIKVAVNPWLR